MKRTGVRNYFDKYSDLQNRILIFHKNTEPAGQSGPFYGQNSLNAALSRLAKMARVFPEMTSDPVSGVLPMRSVAFLVRPAVDYKRYGMLLDMKKLYRNALGTSASERMKNHYRYMLLAIDRALKVD